MIFDVFFQGNVTNDNPSFAPFYLTLSEIWMSLGGDSVMSHIAPCQLLQANLYGLRRR